MDLKDSVFFLVGNIPGVFRSADLRAYFSQFAEKKSFSCFHYRHRPEQLKPRSDLKDTHSVADVPLAAPEASAGAAWGARGGGHAATRCCVVAVRDEGAGKDFVKRYHKKNWSCSDGSLLPGKVRISRLDVCVGSDPSTGQPVPGSGGSKIDDTLPNTSILIFPVLCRCDKPKEFLHPLGRPGGPP